MKKVIYIISLLITNYVSAQWNHPQFKCGTNLVDAQNIYKELFETTMTKFDESSGETWFSMGAPTEGYVMTYVDNKLVKVEHYYQTFDEEVEEEYHEYETILICE